MSLVVDYDKNIQIQDKSKLKSNINLCLKNYKGYSSNENCKIKLKFDKKFFKFYLKKVVKNSISI